MQKAIGLRTLAPAEQADQMAEGMVDARVAMLTAVTYEHQYCGNRTRKVDFAQGVQTCYHYGIEDPATYGSANNRLELYQTFDLACGDCSTCSSPQSTTWYYYTMAGNVRRVVTREEPAVASRKGGLNGLDGGRGLRDGGAVASSVLAHYEATRFEYACNGVAVTYAMGESWDIDVTDPATVLNPQINWAREFRYDGARARYLNKQLDPGPLEMLPTASVFDLPGGQSVETIYDGDEPYADRPGSLPWTLFAPGIARVEGYDPFAPPVGSVNTDYYHSDMLGTMRTMSSPPRWDYSRLQRRVYRGRRRVHRLR